MPGAGGLVASNFIYNVAPKDGTIIGMIPRTLPVFQLLEASGVQFDARKFHYLGSPVSAALYMAAWHTSGIKSIEDAQTKELIIGATQPGDGADILAKLLNELIGTKFKIVYGYKGTPEINLAIEGGEVFGRATSYDAVIASTPHWLEQGLLNFIVCSGPENPALKNVPKAEDYATSAENRLLLTALQTYPHSMGRPFILGPDIPEERLSALDDAFAAMLEDPEFLAAAEKQKIGIAPVSGKVQTEYVNKILSLSPELAARSKELMAVK